MSVLDITGATLKLGTTPGTELHNGNTTKCSVSFEASVEELPTFGSYPDAVPVATKRTTKLSVEYLASSKVHPTVGSTTAFALVSPALSLSGDMVISKVNVDDDSGSGAVKCQLEASVKPGYVITTT